MSNGGDSASTQENACSVQSLLAVAHSSAKIFGDLNQEARKIGGDQEFLEVHSIALLRNAR